MIKNLKNAGENLYTTTFIKWKTFTTWVDKDTGEIVPEQETKNYIITAKKIKKYVYKNKGKIEVINFAEKNRQLKLW